MGLNRGYYPAIWDKIRKKTSEEPEGGDIYVYTLVYIYANKHNQTRVWRPLERTLGSRLPLREKGGREQRCERNNIGRLVTSREGGGGGMVKDTTGSFSITRSRAYTDRMCLIRVCRTWAETDESGGEGGGISRFQTGILNAAEPIRFGEGREGGKSIK